MRLFPNSTADDGIEFDVTVQFTSAIAGNNDRLVTFSPATTDRDAFVDHYRVTSTLSSGTPIIKATEFSGSPVEPVSTDSFDLWISGPCDANPSSVPPCSPADVGQQGGGYGSDGILDNNDFVVFIDAYFNSTMGVADVGKQGGLPGPDGILDNNDFVVFIDYFFGDCISRSSTCSECGSRPGPNFSQSSSGSSSRTLESESSDRSSQIEAFRAALQEMIDQTPPGARRDQLIEMLNALSPN